MTIEFTVPGKPVPMARPRVTARGTYTPKRCRDYKTAVAIAAKAAMRGKAPMEGALVCLIDLFFAVPVSYRAGKRLAACHNVIKPTGRNTGDGDNHAKAIMDALTGICWRDDSQVTLLMVRKRYGVKDAAIVEITTDDYKGEAGQ